MRRSCTRPIPGGISQGVAGELALLHVLLSHGLCTPGPPHEPHGPAHARGEQLSCLLYVASISCRIPSEFPPPGGEIHSDAHTCGITQARVSSCPALRTVSCWELAEGEKKRKRGGGAKSNGSGGCVSVHTRPGLVRSGTTGTSGVRVTLAERASCACVSLFCLATIPPPKLFSSRLFLIAQDWAV